MCCFCRCFRDRSRCDDWWADVPMKIVRPDTECNACGSSVCGGCGGCGSCGGCGGCGGCGDWCRDCGPDCYITNCDCDCSDIHDCDCGCCCGG